MTPKEPKNQKRSNQRRSNQTIDKRTNRSLRGQAAGTLFPKNSRGVSPYRPDRLVDIFIDPRRFFSTEASLGRPTHLFIAVLALGISSILSWILTDTLLVITEKATEAKIPSGLINSWVELWMLLLVGGVAASGVLWLVAGWWFRERVLLSGASRPDFRLSRIVYVYSSLVRSLPPLIMLAIWSIRYPNYAAVPAKEIFVAAALIVVFSCGELVTAYIGVKTLFEVDKWRAGIWFVMGPAVWYVVALSL